MFPHHKSLPINAPVSEGGAGAMLGKAWAGLCALQLGRHQRPSPPRLEIIQEGIGRKEEAAEDRDRGSQV